MVSIELVVVIEPVGGGAGVEGWVVRVHDLDLRGVDLGSCSNDG